MVAVQYQWERSSVLDNLYSAGFGHIIASHLTARTVIVFLALLLCSLKWQLNTTSPEFNAG